MERSTFIFLVFLAVGIGFAAMPIVVSWLLGYHRKGIAPPKELKTPDAPDEAAWLSPKELDSAQGEPYESGMLSVGPWRQLGFEYIIYAILFLIFDILFVAIFFGLGAWLESPGRVIAILGAIAVISGLMIFYALKSRKYLKL